MRDYRCAIVYTQIKYGLEFKAIQFRYSNNSEHNFARHNSRNRKKENDKILSQRNVISLLNANSVFLKYTILNLMI